MLCRTMSSISAQKLVEIRTQNLQIQMMNRTNSEHRLLQVAKYEIYRHFQRDFIREETPIRHINISNLSLYQDVKTIELKDQKAASEIIHKDLQKRLDEDGHKIEVLKARIRYKQTLTDAFTSVTATVINRGYQMNWKDRLMMWWN